MRENRQAAAGGFLWRLCVFLTSTATLMPRGFKFVIFSRLQTSPKCTVLEPELALTPNVNRNDFFNVFLVEVIFFFFMRGDATLAQTPQCDTLAAYAPID